jgi:hypothetical protein
MTGGEYVKKCCREKHLKVEGDLEWVNPWDFFPWSQFSG